LASRSHRHCHQWVELRTSINVLKVIHDSPIVHNVPLNVVIANLSGSSLIPSLDSLGTQFSNKIIWWLGPQFTVLSLWDENLNWKYELNLNNSWLFIEKLNLIVVAVVWWCRMERAKDWCRLSSCRMTTKNHPQRCLAWILMQSCMQQVTKQHPDRRDLHMQRMIMSEMFGFMRAR
jgi:hypothetical protein